MKFSPPVPRRTTVCHGKEGRDRVWARGGRQREGGMACTFLGRGRACRGVAQRTAVGQLLYPSPSRGVCDSPAAWRAPKSTARRFWFPGVRYTGEREYIHQGKSLFGRRMSLAADLPHLCPLQERRKLSPRASPWSGAWWHIPPHAYLVYSKWSYKSVE